MKLKTNRKVVVIDVDGVMVQNPAESLGQNTITDTDYWANHWKTPDSAALNDEMGVFARAFIAIGAQVIFLTARPEQFRAVTTRLLSRHRIYVRPSMDAMTVYGGGHDTSPLLVMWPKGGVPAHMGSAGWKQTMIAEWKKAGNDILMMVEDYRPNAEAVRSQVPVLLYERQKVSRHLMSTHCDKCGGLAACWCPPQLSLDLAVARANEG